VARIRGSFGGAAVIVLVVLALTSGPGAAQDLQVAPPQPQPDLQVAPPQPQPQSAPPAQQLQPAAPAQQVQPAAPAQQVQPAAPAQQVQPAAPAQQVQPAAPPPTPEPAPVEGGEHPQVQVAPPQPQPDSHVAPPAQEQPQVTVAPPPEGTVTVAPPQEQPELRVAEPARHPDLAVAPPVRHPPLAVAPPVQHPPLHVVGGGGAGGREGSGDGESKRATCAGMAGYYRGGGGVTACHFRDGQVKTYGKIGAGVGLRYEVDPDGEVPDQPLALAGGVGAGIPKLHKRLPSPGADFGFRAPLGESEVGGEISGNINLVLWKGGFSLDRGGLHGFSLWGYEADPQEKGKKGKGRRRPSRGLGGSVDLEFPLTGH
jgi:hypothetical protein